MIPIDDNVSETVANNAHATGSDSGRALWSYQVPSGSVLVITYFGNDISVAAAWGSIEWSFRINGVPVPPYNRILDMIGQIYQPRAIRPVEIKGGDLFEIDGFNNGSGANCDIAAAIKGELWEGRS